MRSGQRDGATSVLERAFSIVNAFTSDDGLLSLAALVEKTGLPKSSVYRLAAQLVDLEILERAGQRYRLGVRLFEFGARVSRERSLRNAVLPYMQDLFEITHETVNLAIRHHYEILYVERISGHRSVRMAPSAGARRPLHCTALGKAILAYSSPTLVEEVISRGLLRRTQYTITGPDMFRGQLDEIRAKGVAFDREEFGTGVVCVAAPVLDGRGNAIAALSVAGPSSRFEPDHVSVALRTIARSVYRVASATPDTA